MRTALRSGVNQDGNVDQGDVDYLINVVAGGDNPAGIDADFNRDGNVDRGEIDAIVDVIAGGCVRDGSVTGPNSAAHAARVAYAVRLDPRAREAAAGAGPEPPLGRW